MRIASGRLRLVAAALLFSGSAAVWLVGVPAARAQTPVTTKICADGPDQLCRTIKTCSGNSCTTNYYYWL